jgi:hypothetical protein
VQRRRGWQAMIMAMMTVTTAMVTATRVVGERQLGQWRPQQLVIFLNNEWTGIVEVGCPLVCGWSG